MQPVGFLVYSHNPPMADAFVKKRAPVRQLEFFRDQPLFPALRQSGPCLV